MKEEEERHGGKDRKKKRVKEDYQEIEGGGEDGLTEKER